MERGDSLRESGSRRSIDRSSTGNGRTKRGGGKKKNRKKPEKDVDFSSKRFISNFSGADDEQAEVGELMTNSVSSGGRAFGSVRTVDTNGTAQSPQPVPSRQQKGNGRGAPNQVAIEDDEDYPLDNDDLEDTTAAESFLFGYGGMSMVDSFYQREQFYLEDDEEDYMWDVRSDDEPFESSFFINAWKQVDQLARLHELVILGFLERKHFEAAQRDVPIVLPRPSKVDNDAIGASVAQNTRGAYLRCLFESGLKREKQRHDKQNKEKRTSTFSPSLFLAEFHEDEASAHDGLRGRGFLEEALDEDDDSEEEGKTPVLSNEADSGPLPVSIHGEVIGKKKKTRPKRADDVGKFSAKLFIARWKAMDDMVKVQEVRQRNDYEIANLSEKEFKDLQSVVLFGPYGAVKKADKVLKRAYREHVEQSRAHLEELDESAGLMDDVEYSEEEVALHSNADDSANQMRRIDTDTEMFQQMRIAIEGYYRDRENAQTYYYGLRYLQTGKERRVDDDDYYAEDESFTNYTSRLMNMNSSVASRTTRGRVRRPSDAALRALLRSFDDDIDKKVTEIRRNRELSKLFQAWKALSKRPREYVPDGPLPDYYMRRPK